MLISTFILFLFFGPTKCFISFYLISLFTEGNEVEAETVEIEVEKEVVTEILVGIVTEKEVEMKVEVEMIRDGMREVEMGIEMVGAEEGTGGKTGIIVTGTYGSTYRCYTLVFHVKLLLLSLR